MKKLFQDFQPVSSEEWLEQIKIDLRGQSLDILNSNPEPGIAIKANYHKDNSKEYTNNTFARNLSNGRNDWQIRFEFDGIDSQKMNRDMLEMLNNGVNAVGIKMNDKLDFKTLSKGVLFEHIQTDIKFTEQSEAMSFNDSDTIIRNFDIININNQSGTVKYTLNDFLDFYRKKSHSKNIWVTGYTYGESGASTIQELAFTIAHLNEYIQFLYDAGHSLSEINEKIVLELSVNENYFVNIAKFRAIRELVQHLFEGYQNGYKSQPVSIFAKTNIRHLAENDRNNNLLRETTQAMSAVIGGCDTLTVQYLNVSNESENVRSARVSKNIQLILKEEAYLNQVKDMSAGAYYIEELTDQIIEKSWNLFLEIENEGGLIRAIKSNFIQAKITENRTALIDGLNNGKNTFLGVNKFSSSLESWKEIPPHKRIDKTDFEELIPFKLESYFIKKTD